MPIAPTLAYYSKEWWREYRRLRGEKQRAYKRNYDKTRYTTHKFQEIERRLRWKKLNPEKVRAQQLVHNALRSGKLTRLFCEVEGCDEINTHAHPEDYSKPLKVHWFCALHHSWRQRERAAKGKKAQSL